VYVNYHCIFIFLPNAMMCRSSVLHIQGKKLCAVHAEMIDNWNFALMASGFRLNAIKVVGFTPMPL